MFDVATVPAVNATPRGDDNPIAFALTRLHSYVKVRPLVSIVPLLSSARLSHDPSDVEPDIDRIGAAAVVGNITDTHSRGVESTPPVTAVTTPLRSTNTVLSINAGQTVLLRRLAVGSIKPALDRNDPITIVITPGLDHWQIAFEPRFVFSYTVLQSTLPAAPDNRPDPALSNFTAML